MNWLFRWLFKSRKTLKPKPLPDRTRAVPIVSTGVETVLDSCTDELVYKFCHPIEAIMGDASSCDDCDYSHYSYGSNEIGCSDCSDTWTCD